MSTPPTSPASPATLTEWRSHILEAMAFCLAQEKSEAGRDFYWAKVGSSHDNMLTVASLILGFLAGRGLDIDSDELLSLASTCLNEAIKKDTAKKELWDHDGTTH